MNWKEQLYNHEILPPEEIWSRISHDLDNDSFIVFKQQLAHLQQTPEPGVWEKINQHLDNEAFLDIKKKVANTQVTPPPLIWEKITQDLDNGAFVFFKEQLAHHEIPAPAATWEKITQNLDNDAFDFFKQHLQNMEVTPPATAWKNIETALSENQVGKVINLPRSSSAKIFKIAAAAAVVGILFLTINNFFVNNSVEQIVQPGKTSVAEKTPVAPANQPVEPATTAPLANNQKSTVPPQYIAANNTISKKAAVKSVQTDGGYTGNTAINTPSPALVAATQQAATDYKELNMASNKRIKNLKGEVREDVSLMDLPHSYFYATGPNGQTIRVSSKFRNTIQYLDGDAHEELLDVILRESGYWKNLFREWKEKVASSSFVPAPENFMDITELIKLLQANQQK